MNNTNVYPSTKKVTIPLVIMTQDGIHIKRRIVTNVISKEEDLFLCGLKTLVDCKAAIFYEGNEIEFTMQAKRYRMEMSKGEHQLVKLEIVGDEEI